MRYNRFEIFPPNERKMKKILLINQHSSNHGDEAAARALTARLAEVNAENSKLYYAPEDRN
jgi:hypothetical protein